MEVREQPFVTYLERFREDRGALAALRRGLGQAPGAAREMYPYVVRWVPEKVFRQQEAAYYLVAALFAYHPDVGGAGNLGESFRRSLAGEAENSATERRFTSLLAAHPEDLPFYLRQAISYLRSKAVPVNWHQLFADIMNWDHPEGWVQKSWARSYWGRSGDDQSQSKQEG